MQDKRLNRRLLHYWERLRGDAPLPRWELFDLQALADIWGQCCVWRVEVNGPKNIYTYEYVGTNACDALGQDLTGQTVVTGIKEVPGVTILQKIDTVVRLSKPLEEEGQFINKNSKIVKYRACLLPFGRRDGIVRNVLLGLSWQAY